MAMLQLYKAIRPASVYAVDEAPTSHPRTAKVFATVRNNGRILDDMKIVIGGTGIFEANFKVKKFITDDVIESRGGPETSSSEMGCCLRCGRIYPPSCRPGMPQSMTATERASQRRSSCASQTMQKTEIPKLP